MFNITGEKELSLSDVSQISKTIFELVNPEAKIIFGISQDKKYQDKIKVALLATGCGVKSLLEKTEKPRKSKKKRTKKRIPVLPRPMKKKRKRKRRVKPRHKHKKVRIKIKKRELLPPPVVEKPEEGIEVRPASLFERGTEVKIRKNALQVKKETEEAEKEFLAKEQAWELPAFLRKPQNK